MILTKTKLVGAALTSAAVGVGGTVVATNVTADPIPVVTPRLIEVTDTGCLISGQANRDTVGRFYLKSGNPTGVQRRASDRLDTLFVDYCKLFFIAVDTTYPVDTTTAPDTTTLPDTTALPDTTPPPPLPDTSTAPLPSTAIGLSASSDTLRIRPATPYIVWLTVRTDSLGFVGDSAGFALSDSSMALIRWNKTQRMLELYTLSTHTRTGPLGVTVSRAGASVTHTVQVVAGAAPAPPTPPADTAPPPPVDTTSALAILWAIGPTRSPAGATAFGSGYAMMDPLWNTWEPVRWAAEGAAWSGNYYDRSQIYFAQGARHGNGVWMARASAMALDYRRNYLHANNYQTSSHWAQLDGVALHYWHTGDDSSRLAVGKAAWNLAGTAMWPRTAPYVEARTYARALTGMLLAWQLQAPSAPAGGWAQAIDNGLTNILSTQSPDGAWRFPVNTCDLSLNYMGAMLADALIRIYTTYRADPRIPPAVKKTADFLWTQWRPNDAIPSFNYYEGPCSNIHGNGGPNPTPDLTGLFTTTYAWMAQQDSSYRPKADAVFLSTMRGLYPQGSKQFNQAFAYSWRALGYLP